MSSFNPAAEKAPVFEVRSLRQAQAFQPAAEGRRSEAGETAASVEPQPDERQRLWQEGFDAAREAHARDLATALAPALQALTRSAEALLQQRRQYLAAQRDAVVELALVVAERIVGEALRERPQHVTEWVEQAVSLLESAGPDTPLRVFLSPEDLEQVGSCELDPTHPVEWLADPQLARGDARVECGASAVRVGLETGLRELRRVLRDITGGGGDES